MSSKKRTGHRLDRSSSPTLRSWQKPARPIAEVMEPDAAVDMGWGKLIFGHTFESSQRLAEALCSEDPGERHLALYLRDPHVVVSLAPDELFLDPSHTYRLWSYAYRPTVPGDLSFVVRRLRTRGDADETNRIYGARNMVTCDPSFMLNEYATRLRTYLVAESHVDGSII
jgi:hypothetical protein